MTEKHTPWMPTDADMSGGVAAAKRIHVIRNDESNWSWWVGHGKDESCQIEGTPNHWFWLAYALVGLVPKSDCPYSEDKPLPFSREHVVACVNACAGLDDPAALRAQNERMRTALKEIAAHYCECVSGNIAREALQ